MDAMAELSGPAATRTSGRGFWVSHNPYCRSVAVRRNGDALPSVLISEFRRDAAT
jgi:hypothetical protein